MEIFGEGYSCPSLVITLAEYLIQNIKTKAFGFTAGILKGALAEGRKKK